jgi:pimeloyl-ACP methyl ester carboxylesterase
MADQADDAAALLAARRWDANLVVGLSFGGMVGRNLAFLEGDPYGPHGMKVSTGQAVTLGTPVPAMQSEARN